MALLTQDSLDRVRAAANIRGDRDTVAIILGVPAMVRAALAPTMNSLRRRYRKAARLLTRT